MIEKKGGEIFSPGLLFVGEPYARRGEGLRPVSAHHLGHGGQGAPDVGRTINDALGEDGAQTDQPLPVAFGPGAEPTAQRVGQRPGLVAFIGLDGLGRLASAHPDDDRARMHRIRELSHSGQGDRGEDRKSRGPARTLD